MRLLVNADDLGSSPKVNDATFALMECGAIRSATILANAPALADAVARAQTFPGCSFGVHLNVTHGVPLATDPALAPLLDSHGQFLSDAIRAQATRRDVRRAVFGEWSRQIERLGREGVTVSHIDSHDHVHTIPWLFGVLKSVQRKFGIRRVRIPLIPPGKPSAAGAMLRLGKGAWRRIVRLDGTRTSDFFCSLADYRLRAEAASFSNDLTTELMVHPGLNRYSEETDLLISDWWAAQLRSNRLVAYDEL